MMRDMRCVAALLVACLAAACGRLGFEGVGGGADAAPDVLLGHDEDGDGIADASDPCPHVAGDAADSDGDGVGDACDPNPALNTERFVTFSALTPDGHPFDDISAWTQEADGLRYAGGGTTFYIPRPVATFRFEVGFEIHALFGVGQHQVASGVEGPTPYYFVELNENDGAQNASIVSFDATDGYIFLGGVNHNGMHVGRGLLRYDAIATAPREFRLLTGWRDEPYAATGPVAQYDGGAGIRTVFNGLDVTVEYVALIETR